MMPKCDSAMLLLSPYEPSTLVHMDFVLLSCLAVRSSFHYSRAISSLLNARCEEWRRVPVSY